MTLVVDVQLLLYAVFDSYQEHSVSLSWFEGILNDRNALVGLPNHTLLGFLRIATNPRISSSPLPMSVALNQVEIWIAQPSVFVPQPASDHISRVVGFIRQASGNHELVADAHLAALAIEHGATMCTHDSDFAKFDGLSILDPLQPPPFQP